MDNKMIMRDAQQSLKGKWGLVLGVSVFFSLLMVFLVIVLTLINLYTEKIKKVFDIAFFKYDMWGFLIKTLSDDVLFLLFSPLFLGFVFLSLAIIRNQHVKFILIFKGFRYTVQSIKLYFFVELITLLWTILFIIPGIVASFAYSMSSYILADDPTINSLDALEKSKKMMYGYKWKLVCLYVRFIPLIFLSIVTLGIGFLWICPYIAVTHAKFYDELKKIEVNNDKLYKVPANDNIS